MRGEPSLNLEPQKTVIGRSLAQDWYAAYDFVGLPSVMSIRRFVLFKTTVGRYHLKQSLPSCYIKATRFEGDFNCSQ